MGVKEEERVHEWRKKRGCMCERDRNIKKGMCVGKVGRHT